MLLVYVHSKCATVNAPETQLLQDKYTLKWEYGEYYKLIKRVCVISTPQQQKDRAMRDAKSVGKSKCERDDKMQRALKIQLITNEITEIDGARSRS